MWLRSLGFWVESLEDEYMVSERLKKEEMEFSRISRIFPESAIDPDEIKHRGLKFSQVLR